jgi:hypothetical protein
MHQIPVFIKPEALLADVNQNKFRQTGNIPDAFGKDPRPYGKVERDINEFYVRAQTVRTVNNGHRLQPVDESDPLAKELEIVIEIFHETTEITDGLPLCEKDFQAWHAIHFDDFAVGGKLYELGVEPSVDCRGGRNSNWREKEQNGQNDPKWKPAS